MMQPDLSLWAAHDIFPHVIYVCQQVGFALPQRSSSERHRSEERAQNAFGEVSSEWYTV